MVTPKLQTSLRLENLRKLMHSGAYHLSGHFPAERAWGWETLLRQGVRPPLLPTWAERGGTHGVVAVIGA